MKRREKEDKAKRNKDIGREDGEKEKRGAK